MIDHYKHAAERHLDTCLNLKEIIQQKYGDTILSITKENEQQELLFNIYYLSGYIIECSLNYSILKFINFDRIKRTNSRIRHYKQLNSRHRNNRYNVSFSHKDRNADYALWQPAHKFQSNILFFAEDSKISGIDHIRGINGNPIEPINVRRLFNDWNVEYRYETKGKILNSNDIFAFLDFAMEIFTELENLGY